MRCLDGMPCDEKSLDVRSLVMRSLLYTPVLDRRSLLGLVVMTY